jgi:uncharacterized protein (TIGR02300 family)
MGAAVDARGLKRICMSCGTRFYDMKKRPITCPSCKEEFSGEIKVKARRGRLPAADTPIMEKPTKPIANDDDDIIADDADTVSLEDVKDLEEAGDDADEDAIDLDEDDLDDLEELEELEDDLEEDIDVKPAGKDD